MTELKHCDAVSQAPNTFCIWRVNCQFRQKATQSKSKSGYFGLALYARFKPWVIVTLTNSLKKILLTPFHLNLCRVDMTWELALACSKVLYRVFLFYNGVWRRQYRMTHKLNTCWDEISLVTWQPSNVVLRYGQWQGFCWFNPWMSCFNSRLYGNQLRHLCCRFDRLQLKCVTSWNGKRNGLVFLYTFFWRCGLWMYKYVSERNANLETSGFGTWI